MYEVLKLGRIHSLSINCQLDLFDKMVKLTETHFGSHIVQEIRQSIVLVFHLRLK
jgi:hypothetical protein